MKDRYLLRVYGPHPRIEDEHHDGERVAIERGRWHLRDRGHGYAEVRDRMDAKIVWNGYVKAGAIVESYEREPGSDDA